MYNINKDMIKDYIEIYSDVDFNIGVDTFLSYWEAAKSNRLLEIFRGNLILEKEICIEKSLDEICISMENEHFEIERLMWLASSHFDIPWREKQCISRLFSNEALATNRTVESFNVTINGKTYKITEGQKTVKAISTLVTAFGLDEKEFETFRNTHSRVLNDKKTYGTLCLSIHPLDYMTMSHNINGWTSCMDWTEGGCYRAGTLEMLNCQYTIVAYLKSKDEIEFREHKWNSKKWRELITITPELIIANRSYPYHHQGLTDMAIDWIRELIPNTYSDEKKEKSDLLEENCRVQVRTVLMYNDAESGQDHKITIARALESLNHTYIEVCMGGQAICLNCGNHLDMEGSLDCGQCNGHNYCSCCDEHVSGEMYYIDETEEYVCEYCYNEYFRSCDECGDRFREENVKFCDREDAQKFGLPYVGYFCKGCIQYYANKKAEETRENKIIDFIKKI